ncbi:Uncharacterised protein [Mycobacteroides abscessus subsp. abscessus]|nr:Uncharacterised protein [Mycobacteroides abscessus subsp. abscessus]
MSDQISIFMTLSTTGQRALFPGRTAVSAVAADRSAALRYRVWSAAGWGQGPVGWKSGAQKRAA